MSAPIGSYPCLGIPDFGRVFEFRWWMQGHHSSHTLASMVPRLFVVFHCALDQGAFARTADSVFYSGGKRCYCAGMDNALLFSMVTRSTSTTQGITPDISLSPWSDLGWRFRSPRMNRNPIVLGAIASILMLCQWFVFQSFRKYLFRKCEGIQRTHIGSHRSSNDPSKIGRWIIRAGSLDKQSSCAYT